MKNENQNEKKMLYEDLKAECNISTSTSTTVTSSDHEDDYELTNLKEKDALFEKFDSDYDKEIDSIIEKSIKLLTTKFCGSGLYQLILVTLVLLIYAVDIGAYTFVNVFAGYTPKHECFIGDNSTQPVDECNILNSTSNQTYECDKWTYDKSQMQSTIISEYDLVCKRNYHFELLFTLEQTGFVFGIIASSISANKFGKKPIILCIISVFSVLGFIQYWMKNFYVYMSIGFFMNFIASGLDGVCIALVLEAFEANHRTKYGMLFSYAWAFFCIALAPIAYFIKTWRELRLLIFLVTAVLSIMAFFVVQESLTWLISSGKLDEAEKVVQKIAKINRISKDATFKKKFAALSALFQQLAKYNEKTALKRNEDKENVYSEIFKYKKFMLYLLLMVFSWCCAGMVYDGLSYLNATIGENIFLNWLLLSVIEIPATIVCHCLNARYGRRMVTCISFIMTGVMLLIAGFNHLQILRTYSFIKTALFVCAKFFSSITMSTIIIHTPEVFPTRIRSFCCGLCVFSNRLITGIAPFISLYLTKIVPWLPALIYGIISIICGVLYAYTPETFNRPLPNSIQEIINYEDDHEKQDKKRRCCC